jgi:hypothetical protein
VEGVFGGKNRLETYYGDQNCRCMIITMGREFEIMWCFGLVWNTCILAGAPCVISLLEFLGVVLSFGWLDLGFDAWQRFVL